MGVAGQHRDQGHLARGPQQQCGNCIAALHGRSRDRIHQLVQVQGLDNNHQPTTQTHKHTRSSMLSPSATISLYTATNHHPLNLLSFIQPPSSPSTHSGQGFLSAGSDSVCVWSWVYGTWCERTRVFDLPQLYSTPSLAVRLTLPSGSDSSGSGSGALPSVTGLSVDYRTKRMLVSLSTNTLLELGNIALSYHITISISHRLISCHVMSCYHTTHCWN